MSYLLDTDVVYETLRKRSEPKVTQWIASVPTEKLYLSVLSLGEIRKGIELSDNISKSNQLIIWLEIDLPQ